MLSDLIGTQAAALLRSAGLWVYLIARAMVVEFAFALFCVVALATLPVLWGDRSLVVMSGSMEPAIPTGASVVVVPVPSDELRPGDVLVVSNEQIPVLHRIVGIDERAGTRYLTTRGDANSNADVPEIAAPQVGWRVWYTVPLVGYLISFATSRWGFVLLIVFPLIGLLFSSVMERARGRRRSSRRRLPDGPPSPANGHVSRADL